MEVTVSRTEAVESQHFDLSDDQGESRSFSDVLDVFPEDMKDNAVLHGNHY